MIGAVQEYLNSFKKIHQNIAQDVWGTNQLTVTCRTCGDQKEVDPSHCLAHGWPKCCGYTMTVDKI